jgi:hypothetical protein
MQLQRRKLIEVSNGLGVSGFSLPESSSAVERVALLGGSGNLAPGGMFIVAFGVWFGKIVSHPAPQRKS